MDTNRENDRETEYTLRCLNMPSSTSVTKTSFTEEIVGYSRMKRSIDVGKEREALQGLSHVQQLFFTARPGRPRARL